MGRLIPAPIVGQSSASGAQIIDGSLKFVSGNSTHLTRTPGSAGNRRTWTFSCWVKVGLLSQGERGTIFSSNASGNLGGPTIYQDSGLRFAHAWDPTGTDYIRETVAIFRDPSAWYHVVWWCDTTQAGTRWKIYVNSVEQTLQTPGSNNGEPAQDTDLGINTADVHLIGNFTNFSYLDGYLSQCYFVDGQALDASYFGFTDPLTNTWRPKKFDISKTPGGSWGTNGFYLPMDGNSPIGEDKSGNGNNWTPRNFGGSNSIEKATGALPILNTANGGNVATVGVRTDTAPGNGPVGVSTHLVLALPLSGNANDVSNQINAGSTTKTITANGNAAGSITQSNFYGASYVFDGTGDYLSTPDSTDFAFGSGDFTVEAWFRATAVPGSGGDTIVSQSGSNTDNRGWQLTIRDTANSVTNPLKLLYSTNGTAWANSSGSDGTSTSTIVTGRWYHGAVSRSGNTWYLFVNGKLENSWTDSNSIFNTTAALEIGSTSALSEAFAGNIQDVRVYNGVAKYTSDFIPASTDPDILPDTPSGVAGGSALSTLSESTTGGSVYFDGSGDYLSLANDTDFDVAAGDFTAEGYFYFTNQSSTGTCFFGKWADTPGRNYAFVHIKSDNKYRFSWSSNGTDETLYTTSVGYPGDVNRWVHLAVVRNGTTLKIYRDGEEILSSSIGSSTIYNSSTSFMVGRFESNTNYDYSGWISNFRLVKGSAVYTSNFTPPQSPLSSVTNTKLLCCKNSSSATASDVTPGTITANGNTVGGKFRPFQGEDINLVRGKDSGYCTLNPVSFGPSNADMLEGNLRFNQPTATTGNAKGTIAVSSGKWYWEVTPQTTTTANVAGGILGAAETSIASQPGEYATGYAYLNTGEKSNNSTETSYGATYGAGDVIGTALDLDAGTLVFYKNGVSQGTAFSGLSGTFVPAIGDTSTGSSSALVCNFGQKPFKYAPPEGFKVLCLANLPRPTKAAVRPDKYVGIVTYSGDSSNNTEITCGFQPDLVWIKNRTEGATGDVGDHMLFDSVRGVQDFLVSNETDIEASNANGLQEFTKKGFRPGSMTRTNETGDNYVAWCWKAGGGTGITTSFWKDGVDYGTAAAAGITEGTISLTGASVNTEAGFSIITWTGAGGNSGTVGHGLNEKPQIIIAKSRDSLDNWVVYTDIIDGSNDFIKLNSPDAKSDSSHANTTSTTFNPYYSQTSAMFVAYCWHSVPGFSKFGSYAGNGNADGPFIHLGFRPAWVMWKQTNTDNDRHWVIRDSVRDVDNPTGQTLYASLFGAEQTLTSQDVDFLSNGFKIRSTWDYQNASGRNYIYAAFAEAPTQNLYGGQANAR